MADQNSRQDENQFPALIAHTGTAGTAETIRVIANTSGQIGVHGTVTSSGAGASINTYGTSGTLTDGSTGTIVNYTSPAGFKLKGFFATGEGQGYFTLEIGVGTTRYFYRTNIADKVARIELPNPETIPTSTTLLLKVNNENGDSRNFEGILLGE